MRSGVMTIDAFGDSGYARRDKCDAERLPDPCQVRARGVEPVWVWHVPFAPLSMAETITAIGNLIEMGQPALLITANTHYAMLTQQNPDLQVINAKAALILADGVPLVWISRWMGSPLPQRVAGSDLVFELSAEAAKRGYRLFLVGGAEGVAEQAAHRLCELYPGLQVVGTECPSLHELTRQEEAALIGRIRAARPHILMVAFGQPKGERWIYRHIEELGVPVSVQVGASLDFVAGRIRRAPLWMQNSGLEWAFRLGLEPRRLFWRYVRNAWFISRMVARDVRQAVGRRRI
jgi:N-acetylglucosaminyldiphosphoundecaprenol N-acetyl-beta-D-mannosaminyltransferase